MKMIYTTPNGRLAFEIEVATGKVAFEVAAAIQELFEEECCGACKSKEIKFDVRTVNENKYYKLRCSACNATLDFGQKKDGKTLFAKRQDKDRNRIPNNGWYHYGGAREDHNDGPPPAAPQKMNAPPGDECPF